MNQLFAVAIRTRAAATIVLLATCCAAWVNAGAQPVPKPQEQVRLLSAREMAAMINRPTSVVELLNNLKLAFDDDWLMQPAFYERSNVLTFFNGTLLSRHSAIKEPGTGEVLRAAFTTVNPAFLKGTTIKFTRGCIPIGKGTFKNSGSLEINVEAVPNFTVGIVKDVFGRNAKLFRSDAATDGGVVRADSKYGLAYEGGTRAKSSVEFFIKLDNFGFVEQVDPPYPKQRDSDQIKKITISEVEREKPSNTDAR